MATTNERSDLDFIAELRKYISNESSNEILEKDPFFYHEEALQAFKNFKEFGKDKEASFYEDRRKDFKTYKEKSNDKIKEKSNGKTKYVNFLDSLKRDSDEFLIFELMGKLLAHFFDKAANKKVWNPNGEVFAAAQHNDAWVDTLL